MEIQQLKDQVESLRSLQDTATAAEREAAKETQKNALMAAHIARLEEQGRRERQLLQSQVRHLTSEVARLQVRAVQLVFTRHEARADRCSCRLREGPCRR